MNGRIDGRDEPAKSAAASHAAFGFDGKADARLRVDTEDVSP